MSYMQRYKNWILSDHFDEETKKELQEIQEDEKEIEDRFYKDLEFGTGGMRGKIGAGTNRMNKYMVHKATQGLANYIVNYIDQGKKKGVALGFDSRHCSPEFAMEAALVLAGNGIKTYLFEELCPVPMLSFAVRELGAATGIVITASHNPPEYNGYKVYGEDGGQIVPEKAHKVMAEIEEVDDFSLIDRLEPEEAEEEGLLNYVGEEIRSRYREEVKNVIPDKDMAADQGKDFDILYTPLHGTGYKPVMNVLEELGFNVEVVADQAEPDPDFSTVESPNPENISAFELALKEAEDKKPAIIIGTDPDCDRLGVMVRNRVGEYEALSGNEAGVLMLDYLLSRQEVPDKGVMIKTIVTTELAREIARAHGVETIDVLTGFKYIGEKIKEFEETGDREFIFGFEESYGYLAGTYARDKDAVLAAALFSVMALYYNQQGSSVLERLTELREQYGYYSEALESIYMEGREGQQKIQTFLNRMREEEPREIAGWQVIRFSDYKKGETIDYSSDSREQIDLPESDVLQYYLAEDSIITIRPSGTEPKLKIYFSVRESSAQASAEKMQEFKDSVLSMIKGILSEV